MVYQVKIEMLFYFILGQHSPTRESVLRNVFGKEICHLYRIRFTVLQWIRLSLH